MNFRLRLPEREAIGQPACPLFYRWTFWDRWNVKAMLHHFMPSMTDPDIHDHPRSFVTFVLRGGYLDLTQCGCQRGTSYGSLASALDQNGLTCPDCGGDGVVGEVMNAPKVKYRHAAHAHSTKTGRRGAWTLIVMGPKIRPWGFWRHGVWFGFKEYEEVFGFARICDSEDER